MEQESLMHYASKYYDPQKAHEYYMRTRQLKGRRSSSALTEEGKEAWEYTKDQITTSKKEDMETLKTNKEQNIEALRNKSEQTKARILAKLTELKEKIDKERASKLDTILDQKIPENLSKEERARRIAMRDKQIAKLYSDSKRDKAKASVSSNKEIQDAGVKIQASIKAAREAYTANKTTLNEHYETIYQREYDKILSEYQKPEKTTKSKKT